MGKLLNRPLLLRESIFPTTETVASDTYSGCCQVNFIYTRLSRWVFDLETAITAMSNNKYKEGS